MPADPLSTPPPPPSEPPPPGGRRIVPPGLDYTEVDPLPGSKAPLEPLVIQPAGNPRMPLYVGLMIAIVVLGGLVLKRTLERGGRPAASTPEAQAQEVLRTLGASQHAYAERNPDGQFASPDELGMAQLLPFDFDRATAIRDYSVAVWEVHDPTWESSGVSEAPPGEPLRTRRVVDPARFTLVATPTGGFRGLRTFGLCEDLQMRVAPPGTTDLGTACEWPSLD
ncbi:MAG TPA: hypothetical protein VEI97_19355 [bacterium]|nr:hypothetical protein [bacterium]